MCVRLYQRVEVVAEQSSLVDDVSFEDDKEEEEPQQHVAQVTEDVVEGAACDRKCVTTTLTAVA